MGTTANLLADALAAQTGMRAFCCQSSVAGISWGLEEIPFAAENETARSVLWRLIVAVAPDRAGRKLRRQRCDPEPGGWCFIELFYAN